MKCMKLMYQCVTILILKVRLKSNTAGSAGTIFMQPRHLARRTAFVHHGTLTFARFCGVCGICKLSVLQCKPPAHASFLNSQSILRAWMFRDCL